MKAGHFTILIFITLLSIARATTDSDFTDIEDDQPEEDQTEQTATAKAKLPIVRPKIGRRPRSQDVIKRTLSKKAMQKSPALNSRPDTRAAMEDRIAEQITNAVDPVTIKEFERWLEDTNVEPKRSQLDFVKSLIQRYAKMPKINTEGTYVRQLVTATLYAARQASEKELGEEDSLQIKDDVPASYDIPTNAEIVTRARPVQSRSSTFAATTADESMNVQSPVEDSELEAETAVGISAMFRRLRQKYYPDVQYQKVAAKHEQEKHIPEPMFFGEIENLHDVHKDDVGHLEEYTRRVIEGTKRVDSLPYSQYDAWP